LDSGLARCPQLLIFDARIPGMSDLDLQRKLIEMDCHVPANIVSVGICEKNGRHVTFRRFIRYGLPITLVQLFISTLYIVGLIWPNR
jgi:hypothetical protein